MNDCLVFIKSVRDRVRALLRFLLYFTLSVGKLNEIPDEYTLSKEGKGIPCQSRQIGVEEVPRRAGAQGVKLLFHMQANDCEYQ